MKRKRNLLLVIFLMVTFMAATLPVLGSAEDYKVIKRAVKNKKTTDEVTWFRLEVTDKAAKKAKVKIRIPLSLVELFADCEKEAIDLKDKCKISLKTILKELKKNGPMTLIEAECDKELVKIWFE
ncbi:MAG: hypothetical protein PVH61_08445 [Candidatus Aminicenantes bacterium]|jgi:hypothetical protein